MALTPTDAWPAKRKATIRSVSRPPMIRASSRRQFMPLCSGWEYDGPRKLLPNTTLNIDYLIAQSLSIGRGLDAVQILDILGHPVCSTGASSADLEADYELMRCVGVPVQHFSQPIGFDVTLATQAGR